MKQDLRKRGFSLVELLVVIGIIALLMGILIPVISKLKQSGYKADTANEIGVIRAGIDTYYLTFRAYPGPLNDADMFGLTNNTLPSGLQAVTEAENLALGLVGGLVNIPGTGIVFDPTQVGTGPRSLNPTNPKKYDPFVNDAAKWLSKNGTPNNAAEGVLGVTDSPVPEFMDRFPNSMPILYLRARVGATGVISDSNSNGSFQYDVRQFQGYTGSLANPAKYYGVAQTVQNHNLGVLGPDPATFLPPTGVPYDALGFFQNPALNGGAVNALGIPRCKDGYILIAAGSSRIYGAVDAITSFGSVGD
jgi:prepilin-type N-terminal cleavage/methylation domain-containing protein